MPTKPSAEYTQATQMALQDDAARLGAHDSFSKPVPPSDSTQVLTPAQKAQRLRALDPAIYMYGSAAPLLGEALDIQTWKVYADEFLEDLKAPADPVAKMLATQLAMAHHALGRLHVRAAARVSPQEVATYYASIARLMAEFRRSALALKAYIAGSPRCAADSLHPKAKSSMGTRTARRKKKAKCAKVPSNNRLKEYLDVREPSHT